MPPFVNGDDIDDLESSVQILCLAHKTRLQEPYTGQNRVRPEYFEKDFLTVGRRGSFKEYQNAFTKSKVFRCPGVLQFFIRMVTIKTYTTKSQNAIATHRVCLIVFSNSDPQREHLHSLCVFSVHNVKRRSVSNTRKELGGHGSVVDSEDDIILVNRRAMAAVEERSRVANYGTRLKWA